MSLLASALGGRTSTPRAVAGPADQRDGTGTPGVTTLADLRRHQAGRVVGYGEADPRTTRRLFDLGLAPGAEVEVVRVAPLRDPVIFRVADYELALRRSEARGVHVERT